MRKLFHCFLFRSEDDRHFPPFEFGHAFGNAVVFEFLDEFEQEEFAAFLEDDGAATELHISPDLGAFIEELLGVAGFELKVVVVGVGPEADFLDDGFGRFGFEFLLFLLPVVEKFFKVDDADYRWNGVGGDFDQVEFHFFRPFPDLTGGVDFGFDCFSDQFAEFVEVISHEADFRNADLVVDAVRGLRLRPPKFPIGIGNKIFCQTIKNLVKR